MKKVLALSALISSACLFASYPTQATPAQEETSPKATVDTTEETTPALFFMADEYSEDELQGNEACEPTKVKMLFTSCGICGDETEEKATEEDSEKKPLLFISTHSADCMCPDCQEQTPVETPTPLKGTRPRIALA